MKSKIKLSVSLICADLFNIKDDFSILYIEGIDYIHFDIMDGHFVPRIGLGTFFLKQIIKNQQIPIEVHLMVTDPEKYINELANKGASIITFHYETKKDIYKIIQNIKKHNNKIKIGIALNPLTSIDVIIPLIDSLDMVLLMAYSPGTYSQKPFPYFENKIKELKELLSEKGKEDIDIAIDGGITIENIKKYKDCGANFFILGTSALFIPGKKLKNQIRLVKKVLDVS